MNRFTHLASLLLAASLLGGCPETTRCADGFVRQNRECVPAADAGRADGGDASPDAGPCGICPATEPVCVDVDGTFECRECGSDTDCSGGLVCDPTTFTCEQCVDDADCTAPDAAQCVDNQCQPCGDDAHCAGVVEGGVALDICDAGTCVECTVDTEATDCGANVCDPETLRCNTGAVRGAATNCAPCISDTHCAADHLCVPMFFEGESRGQAYCLRDQARGCARPFQVEIARTTRSGLAGLRFCGINEALTTCEAVLAFSEAGATCASGSDTECAPEGAVCGTVSGGPNTCTYRCSAPLECPGTWLCPAASGYCGGPSA